MSPAEPLAGWQWLERSGCATTARVTREERRSLAEAVRRACVEAVGEAFEEGGLRGLCAEGRIELALGALRALDLEPLIDPPRPSDPA